MGNISGIYERRINFFFILVVIYLQQDFIILFLLIHKNDGGDKKMNNCKFYYNVLLVPKNLELYQKTIEKFDKPTKLGPLFCIGRKQKHEKIGDEEITIRYLFTIIKPGAFYENRKPKNFLRRHENITINDEDTLEKIMKGL